VILEKPEVLRTVSLDDYHAAPYLSTSKLADYDKRGPRYFAMRHVQNKFGPTPSTEAQVFGQAFEDLVCESERLFADRYAVKPAGMKFSTKEGMAWKKAHESAGKEIITEDQRSDLYAMREALWENESAMDMIRGADTQLSIRAPYAGTPGIQSRPDWYSSGCPRTSYNPYTLDLKTTIHFNRLREGRGVIEYRYHIQAALAHHACRVAGLGTNVESYLLVVEKCLPYRCQVLRIGDDWIAAGWEWAEAQLHKLARNYATNTWPRVESEIASLPVAPAWLKNTLPEEAEEEAA
jgi:hypothetical protein